MNVPFLFRTALLNLTGLSSTDIERPPPGPQESVRAIDCSTMTIPRMNSVNVDINEEISPLFFPFQNAGQACVFCCVA